jgi:broad-specificity NMP kinase
MEQDPVGILLITGTLGTGKTTIAAEIGEQLADLPLPNAIIDLDWLGWVNAGDDFLAYDLLIAKNITSTWPNYRAVGVRYLVLARALLQRELVDVLSTTFPNTPITIIRLTASKDTIKQRLSQRDSGETLREHLEELDEMIRIMDDLHLESAIVNTDLLSVEETAQQIINITNWNSKGSN